MSKQHILENTKQNSFVYPKAKVILGFGIIGTLIGTLLLMIPIFFGVVLDNGISFNQSDVIESLYFLGFFMVVGAMFGCVPAFLTGIILALKEYSICRLLDYCWVFLLGAVLSFGGFILMMRELYEVWVIIALLGGISSMICGKLFLPKLSDLPKDFNQKK